MFTIFSQQLVSTGLTMLTIVSQQLVCTGLIMLTIINNLYLLSSEHIKSVLKSSVQMPMMSSVTKTSSTCHILS